MSLVKQFGCEGFADIASLADKTLMDTSFPNTAGDTGGNITDHSLVTKSVFGTLNEKWIVPGNQGVSWRTGAPKINGQTEYEFSFAVYFENLDIISDESEVVARMAEDNSEIQIRTIVSPQSGKFRSLGGTWGSNRFAMDQFAHVEIIENSVFYITMRVRGGTSGNADDLDAEIYVNEKLIASEYNFAGVRNFASNSEEMNSVASGFFGNIVGDVFYRNISIRHQWSTPTGVAPKAKHIQDATAVNTVFSGSGAVVGGVAADQALSDGLNTTYLESTDANETLDIISFTNDPLLANFDVVDFTSYLDISKNSAAINDINVKTVNANTEAQLSTIDYTITSVSPARDNAVISSSLTAPTALTDLRYTITNGS